MQCSHWNGTLVITAFPFGLSSSVSFPTPQELALTASLGSAAGQERSDNQWSGFSRLRSWGFSLVFPPGQEYAV